jgi:hypothetical protein
VRSWDGRTGRCLPPCAQRRRRRASRRRERLTRLGKGAPTRAKSPSSNALTHSAGHQRPSEAIRGHQSSSGAIRGQQRPTEAIWGHLGPSGAIWGHQRQSSALRAMHTSTYPGGRLGGARIVSRREAIKTIRAMHASTYPGGRLGGARIVSRREAPRSAPPSRGESAESSLVRAPRAATRSQRGCNEISRGPSAALKRTTRRIIIRGVHQPQSISPARADPLSKPPSSLLGKRS